VRGFSVLLLGVLALIPCAGEADTGRRVDRLFFSVHIDLLSHYDLEELRRDLEDARVAFQGSQGPTDVACCTQIDAIDLEVFGTPGDGLDVIDSEAKDSQLGSMNALVLDITWPTPRCGSAPLGGIGMTVALDCLNIGNIIAHERGHNAGLNHRDNDSCLPLMRNSRGGCLNVSECNFFRALGVSDGVCTCLDPRVDGLPLPGGPPLPDGAACILDGEVGVCRAGGVCIEGPVPSFFPYQKISDTEGGFTGGLPDRRTFQLWMSSLGDLDNDGVGDLAVRRGPLHDASGVVVPDTRGMWILFLNANGTVRSHKVISSTEGGFVGDIKFGDSTSMGDVDGDGVVDLAVSDWGTAVWILFLNPDGTVKSQQEISTTAGGFTGTYSAGDQFAEALASADFDGDGVVDLAVGERDDDDGGEDRGAVWILFLYNDGTVRSHQKISDMEGNFTGDLDDFDHFGEAVASLGDLNGDGVGDLAVGNFGDDDGGFGRGAVWVLFLDVDGRVKSHQKISSTEGGFTGALDNGDSFGRSVASMGDLDGNGVIDLAVGASSDDDGGTNRGAVWFLFLNADGTVKSHEKISSTQGGFAGSLDDDDRFGDDVAALGDFNGNGGGGDLAVHARLDDDGEPDHGAVWILFMPEPDSFLQLVIMLGLLILLSRARLRAAAP
jgi:hypothetical protein